MTLAAAAGAAASSASLLALAAYTGRWAWREWFPYHGEAAWTS